MTSDQHPDIEPGSVTYEFYTVGGDINARGNPGGTGLGFSNGTVGGSGGGISTGSSPAGFTGFA